MATVQDYLNMAVSMSIGNKSGTDNFIKVPDDFRKFTDLKVKNFSVETGSLQAGNTGGTISRQYTSQGFCLVFFSHPVNIRKLSNVDITDATNFLSFVGFGRNVEGTAVFGSPIVQYDNDLRLPDFDSTSGSGDRKDVTWVAFHVELDDA
jgi:hypothetical protein